MNSSSPFKTLFLSLYFINNTLNENLLFDQQKQLLQNSKDLKMDKVNTEFENQTIANIFPLLHIPQSHPGNRRSAQGFETRESQNPPLQISKLKSSYQYENDKLPVHPKVAKKLTQRLINVDEGLANPKPESREGQETKNYYNETIINQENYYIIIAECTKSSIRQNYSHALSEAAKGGKGAVEALTKIIKSKVNKTTATPAATTLQAPVSTTECNNQDFSQKISDQILTTTSETFVKNSTKINSLSLLSTLYQVASTVSILKNISDIYSKSIAIIKSSTTMKPQTQKINIPSSPGASVDPSIGTTMEITQKNPSTKISTKSTTTTTVSNDTKKSNEDQNNMTTICPSSPGAPVDSSIYTTMKITQKNSSTKTSTKSRTKTTTVSNDPKKQNKDQNVNITTICPSKSQNNMSPPETTCLPVIHIINIYHNKSSPSPEKIIPINSQENGSKKIIGKRNSSTQLTQTSTTNQHDNTNNFIKSSDLCKTRYSVLNDTSQEKEMTGQSTPNLEHLVVGKFNLSSDSFNNITIYTTYLPLCSKDYDENENMYENNQTNNEYYDTPQDRASDGQKDKIDELENDTLRTEKSTNRCSSTRRHKPTTQMLPQKIFSPTKKKRTIIQSREQSTSSVLVIKLLSVTSEKPPLDLDIT